jgi:predicted metal-binding membrane protein
LTIGAGTRPGMTDTALESLLRRDRAIVAACLAAMIAIAWSYLLWLARTMPMAGMDANAMPMAGMDPAAMQLMEPAPHPWQAMEFIAVYAMWAVMMVAMMLPSAAPMILLYARVGRQAEHRGKPFAATGFFALGYLFAWAGFSLAATLAQWQLARALLLDPALASTSGALSGLLLVAAGLFQWTALKDACLAQCQAPLQFIHRHGGFRGTPRGAFAIGLRHGAYCLGCCWALMALLFVGGVMNIAWIALLSLFVLAEKLAPRATWLPRIAGLVLVGAGAWMLITTTA